MFTDPSRQTEEEYVTWLDFDIGQSFEAGPFPLLSLRNRPGEKKDFKLNIHQNIPLFSNDL